MVESHADIPESIGVLELETIHRGLETVDRMIKVAGASILAADPIPPGRFLIVIGGPLADVEVSWRRGLETAGALHDRLLLAHVHPGVFEALRPGARGGHADALGIFETASVASGLAAADRGLKGAAVRLLHLHPARGIAGKTFGVFEGRQDMVEAALEAAEERGRAHGRWVGGSLLARPDERTVTRVLEGAWGGFGGREIL